MLLTKVELLGTWPVGSGGEFMALAVDGAGVV